MRGKDNREQLRLRSNMRDCSGTAYQASAVVRPSRASIKYFDTNKLEDTDSILVRVRSLYHTDNLKDLPCTLISIQDPLCPPMETLGEAMR